LRDARQRVAEVEAQAAAAGRAADYRAKESIAVRLYLPRSCNFGRGEVVPGGGDCHWLATHRWQQQQQDVQQTTRPRSR
jgi:hypothetical protein